MKKIAVSLTVLAFSAAASIGIIEASRDAEAGIAIAQASAPVAAGSAVTIEPMTPVTVNAGSGSTVVVTPATATPVPDPVEDPGGAIAALAKLYKDGQLTALFYLLGFFALVYAERKIKWLSIGYRKVAVTALLFGAGMLAERAVAGTTPNLSMIVGAIGAAALMAFKAYGAKPTPQVAKA